MLKIKYLATMIEEIDTSIKNGTVWANVLITFVVCSSSQLKSFSIILHLKIIVLIVL